ncbi:MAG: hypothetical protein ACRD0K_30555 [Egibacteraceae bacterium]
MAAASWVTVSWVATASSSTVESSARRLRPFKRAGLADHVFDGVVDAVGPV